MIPGPRVGSCPRVKNSMPSATITDALESLNTSAPPTFMDLLNRLYHMRYQGNVVLHFDGGVARAVTLNQPIHITLDCKPLTSAGK